MVALAFNGQGIKVQYGSDGGGLPAGKHKVIIEKTEMVPTKDNSGNQMLQITLKCVEGLAQGGFQKDNLNIHHNIPRTVEIANSQLAAYALVTLRRVVFNDTIEMHNIPFFVEVGPQRNNPEYTEIKKLFDIDGNEAGKAAGAPQVGAGQVQPAPGGFGPVGGGFHPGPNSVGNGPSAWGQSQGGQTAQQTWGQPQAAPGGNTFATSGQQQVQQPQQQVEQSQWANQANPNAGQQQQYAQQQVVQPAQTQGNWQPQQGGTAPGWAQR